MGLLPRSVRARLTLWYTLVLGIPLIAFAVVSYLIFSRTLRSRTDAFLSDALTAFASEIVSERRVHPEIDDAIRTTVNEVRFRDLDIMVVDAAGRVVAATLPSATERGAPARVGLDSASLLAAVRSPAGGSWTGTLQSPQGGYRLLVRPLPLGERYRLAGVYPLAAVEATLQRTRAMFLFAIPILLASAAAGGAFLAKRSFQPVSAMAARAAEIGATTLHERLPVVADDELGALARVLNELLDRLERSFAQQRRFMTDASHELRTPAAIVRAEADITLSREHRAEPEYRESMAVVQDAARRLTRIVDDIFLLARADAGQLVMQPAPLYLEDLLRETVRAVRPLAERRSIRVELGTMVEGSCQGDADLLGRVVLNLLDNAIKHSGAGDSIQVAMAGRGSSCEISVVDSGSGIPLEAQERVFERFFRADPARSRTEPGGTSGAGLGLAIGRRIAEMHGGSLILVGSRPGRTEFRLTLPVSTLAA